MALSSLPMPPNPPPTEKGTPRRAFPEVMGFPNGLQHAWICSYDPETAVLLVLRHPAFRTYHGVTSSSQWGELLQSGEAMTMPSDPEQMPDVIIHLLRVRNNR